MKEPNRDKGRLEHILSAIDNVFEYSQNMTLATFVKNKVVCHAITYNIQVVGEAASRLSKDFIETHNDIDWRDIISMRNVLVHDYYNIDLNVLWNVVQFDLPPFREKILSYLDEY